MIYLYNTFGPLVVTLWGLYGLEFTSKSVMVGPIEPKSALMVSKICEKSNPFPSFTTRIDFKFLAGSRFKLMIYLDIRLSRQSNIYLNHKINSIGVSGQTWY